MSVIYKCHIGFCGLANYIQILGTFCVLAQIGRHGPCFLAAGHAFGAMWASNFYTVKVSALILRLGAATTFPALIPHLRTVVSEQAFLHRQARRLRPASPRVLAWQFLKIPCAYFWPRTGAEKGHRTAPGDGLCDFFPWWNFGPFHV